jgi:hypothetical protein
MGTPTIWKNRRSPRERKFFMKIFARSMRTVARRILRGISKTYFHIEQLRRGNSDHDSPNPVLKAIARNLAW